MGRNFRAARVFQTVQTYTSSNRLTKDFDTKVKPAWFAAVQANPPTEILTRPYPIQHQPLDPNARKAHNMYKPTKIVYPEDELRSTFYRDHPWELARPRLILELDGKDARSRNWKYLRQPGMALSGECVVQRQLWLMENQGMSKEKAYDVARKEFYKLRQQEQIERRIALEEARYVGAYFGKTNIQVGDQLEIQSYNKWRDWASLELAKQAADKTASADPLAEMEEAKASETVAA